MTIHYAATLAEVHEAEFLRFAELGRDGREVGLDPADVYELVQLDRHTDRVLPNGYCLLPPPKRCDRGNACLTCNHFATDARHLGELRTQLAETETLVESRRSQHLSRTGTEMGEDNVWLRERRAEVASLRAVIAALEAPEGPGCGGAVGGRGWRPEPSPWSWADREGGGDHSRGQGRHPAAGRPGEVRGRHRPGRGGVRKLVRAKEPVNFRAVAEAAGVSVDSATATPSCEAASSTYGRPRGPEGGPDPTASSPPPTHPPAWCAR